MKVKAYDAEDGATVVFDLHTARNYGVTLSVTDLFGNTVHVVLNKRLVAGLAKQVHRGILDQGVKQAAQVGFNYDYSLEVRDEPQEEARA
jgi:hypothetical protein